MRLTVERDTLTLYGSAPVAAPVRLLDGEGRAVPARGVRLRLASDGVARVVHDSLACVGAGSTEVTATAGALEGRLTLRCRPRSQLRLITPFIELMVGDRPLPLRVEAAVAPDSVEPVRALGLTSLDTTIVRVRADGLQALRVGRVQVRIDVGGVTLPASVTVRERIADDTLRLAPGESRSWRLPPGRFEIRVAPVADPREFAALELSTEGLKCAPDPRSEEVIHCVVHEQGAVTMEHPAGRGAGRAQRAVVRITRAP